jgi:hypothetical protein
MPRNEDMLEIMEARRKGRTPTKKKKRGRPASYKPKTSSKYRPKSKVTPKKKVTPRADLAKYNVPRRAGYTPPYTHEQRRLEMYPRGYTPPTLNTAQLEAMQAAYLQNMRYREIERANQLRAGIQSAPGGVTPGFTGHRVNWRPITRGEPHDLMNYAGGTGVPPGFSGHDIRMMDIPYQAISRWGYRLRQQAKWRYLEDYPTFEEPIAPPPAQYKPEPTQPYYDYSPRAGYGGGGGGGRGYTAPEPEPPKQYGNVRTAQQRNVPQWLMDMVIWNI